MDSPDSYRISVPGSTQVSNERCYAFAYRTITFYGWLSHTYSASVSLCNSHMSDPTTPTQQAELVWAIPRSLATTRRMISFPLGTKMFQFPRFPSSCLYIQHAIPLVYNGGFPHSDIPGLTPVHGSPRLIAVSHVLHRHLTPRHPP